MLKVTSTIIYHLVLTTAERHFSWRPGFLKSTVIHFHTNMLTAGNAFLSHFTRRTSKSFFWLLFSKWLNEPCTLPPAWCNLNFQHRRRPHTSNCQYVIYNLLRKCTNWLGEITEHSSVSSLAISLKLNCVMGVICDRKTSVGKQWDGLRQINVSITGWLVKLKKVTVKAHNCC